jgi:hypothetical protein
MAAFESEKITALSDLFLCRFSRRSAVRMASLQDGYAMCSACVAVDVSLCSGFGFKMVFLI